MSLPDDLAKPLAEMGALFQAQAIGVAMTAKIVEAAEQLAGANCEHDHTRVAGELQKAADLIADAGTILRRLAGR